MDKAIELGRSLNWVDVAALVVLAGFFIYGAVRGFMLQLAGITVLVLAILVASGGSDSLGRWLSGKFPQLTENPAKYISFGILFLVAAGLGMGLAHLVKGALEKAKVLAYDRFLGGLLGILKGAILVVVLVQLWLNVALREDERPSGISADIVESKTGSYARWTSDKILVFLPADISAKLRDYNRLP